MKMTTEFLHRFSAGDAEGVLELLDDSAIWRVMGREGGLPLSGSMDRTAIVALLNTVRDAFPKGMTLTPTGWTSEEERVAVEVESYGKKDDGTVYNNFYHFIFEFAGGHITAIREYMDTLHVKSVLIDS